MYRKLNSKERRIIETNLFQAVDDIMALLANRKFKFTEDQIKGVIKHAKRIEKNADAIDTLMVESWCVRNKVVLDPIEDNHDTVKAALEMLELAAAGRSTSNEIKQEDI